MQWIKAVVRTTTAGAELVTGVFLTADILGAQIEDKADVAKNQRPEGAWDIIDEAVALRMSDDVLVTGYFPDDERAANRLDLLRAGLLALREEAPGVDAGKLTMDVSRVDEEDWASGWKADYHPFRLGKTFVVRPTWTEYDEKPGDRVISLDPGMAFGTGTHETTAMCVALVEERVKAGDLVIDVGTGSGILAIAAAMCGARRVLAVDVDALAVRVARENALLNGVSDAVEAREGDLLTAVEDVCDVMVANIIADVIVMLAQPARARIRDGGTLICSGIARERKDEVLRALSGARYTDLDIREQGEWCAIAAKKG